MPDPVIRYLGTGSDHHPGIPARTLTAEEYEALDSEERKLVRESPIYDYAAYRDAQKASKEKARGGSPEAPSPSPPPKGADDKKPPEGGKPS